MSVLEEWMQGWRQASSFKWYAFYITHMLPAVQANETSVYKAHSVDE